MSDCCGYCNRAVQNWRRSPHGRPYCPHCRAIRGPYQGEVRDAHSKWSVGGGW